MEILNAIAYAYILQTIEELDETTSQELMRRLTEENLTDGIRTIEEELANFVAEQSISVDAVEWIKKSWREYSGKEANEFANEILDDFMTTIW